MGQNLGRWVGRAACLAATVVALLAGCRPAPGGGLTSPRPNATAGQLPPALQRALEKQRQQLKDNEDFRRGRMISLGFHEDTTSPLCAAPTPMAPGDLDIDRSFWIHDRATLDAVDPAAPAGMPADFSLKTVLGFLARQAPSSSGLTGTDLFAQFWDTFNEVGSGSGPRCSDDAHTLNGYPVSCRSGEGEQAQHAAAQIQKYWPIGLVNRIDLAHEGWRNCGEFRIVYGRNDVTKAMAEGQRLGRAFMIFEGILPNPRPGCRSACQPVAEFWANLSDPGMTTAQRAAELRKLYFGGLPGFEPVVRIEHYSAEGEASVYGSSGGGQVRANLFINAPWLMKEFRLSLDCDSGPCDLTFFPTMVKTNPFAKLWSAPIAGTPSMQVALQGRALGFQASVLANLDRLSGKGPGGCPGPSGVDINHFGYPVDVMFDGGQSEIFTLADSHYEPESERATTGPSPHSFVQTIETMPGRCGLTGRQVVARAQTQSCAGCHDAGNEFHLTGVNAIGSVLLPNGTTTTGWPKSLGFVHAMEFQVSGVHQLSPALLDAFLPERRRFMVEDVLNKPTCPCKETFAIVPPPLRHRFVKVEDEVTQRFAPRVLPEVERLRKLQPSSNPKAANAAEVRKVRAELARLERERQVAVVEAVMKEGLQLPPLDAAAAPRSATPGAAQLKEGNPKRARELRHAAILDYLRREPPRRTVTGSFTVH